MACPDIETFEDYLARRLPEARRQDLDGHRDRCPACQRLLQELEEHGALVEELEQLGVGSLSSTTLPEEVGPYRIERLLGEGGMGVVYEARQPSLDRRVALKVMRGDMTDPRRIRSFEREVQTLARLKHPSIAVIFEAGRAAGGEHYFAMELVEGTPLDRYLATVDPPREDRLRMFCEICSAIDYAHGMGVVHRDLKPANIMVDAAGAPKVLDFGLARLMDPHDRLASTIDSGLARIQGTLPYMSPEQARGAAREVGPASDTYSLGVLLHEMLTGTRPLDMRDVTPLRAVQMICEEIPRPPSFFRPGIPIDLDLIAGKCVRKEAAARYSSVDELRRDVVRHLNGDPILARPLSAAYRLKRYVAGHRALTAALFLLVVSLTGSAIWQVRQAARARSDADRATRRGEFMQGFLVSLNPQKVGRVLTLPQVLETALGDIDAKFEGDPEGEAEVRFSIGRTLGGLGLEEEALGQLEQALAVYRELGPDFAVERIDCMEEVALFLRLNWRFEEAERVLFELQGLRDPAQSLGPEALRSTDGLARVEGALADLRMAQGRHRDAVEHAERSVELRRSLSGDQDVALAAALSLLAHAQLAIGAAGAGLEAFEEAFELIEARNGMRHAQTAIAWGNVGQAHADNGDLLRGEEILRESMVLLEELLGVDHFGTAMSWGSLGVVLARLGRGAEAEPLLTRAMDWFREASPSQYLRGLVFQAQLALLLAARGELDGAEEILGRIVQQRRKALDNRMLPGALNDLGKLLTQAGRLAEAEAAFQESLDLYDSLGRGEDESALSCRNNLASILALRGRASRAEQLFRQFIASAEETLGPEHPKVGTFSINLSFSLRDQWKSKEAEEAARRALDLFRRIIPSRHPIHIQALANIAAALLQRREFEAAADCLEDALQTGDGLLEESHALMLKVRHMQAELWLETGELELADEESRELLQLREAREQNRDLADALVLRGRVLVRGQDFEAAEAALARAADLRRETLIEGHWRIAVADSLRGESLVHLNRLAAAETLLLESAADLKEALGASNPLSVAAEARLSRFFEARGRLRPSDMPEER